MILGFLIWTLVALIFFGIGLSCRKAREAVGFFTFVKPPVVKDINQYNHAVAALWFVFAAILELLGIPVLFLEQNSPLFLLVPPAVIVLVIGAMLAYLRIEQKYIK